jgi:hypothetical protein
MADGERIERFYWNSPGDILAITHGGQIGMPLLPPGIPSLAGTAAERQIAVLIRLKDAEGRPVGVGCELEITAPPGEGDQLDVYFTITLPGRGALMVYETKNYANPAIRPALEEYDRSGAWSGEIRVVQTTGPDQGRGVILAATGEFEGMTGYLQQHSLFRQLNGAGGDVDNCEEIRFAIKQPLDK